jgi:hypothetical protein
MPLKTESLEEPGGRVIVRDGHQTSESVIILPNAAQAAGLRNISTANLPRSQES